MAFRVFRGFTDQFEWEASLTPKVTFGVRGASHNGGTNSHVLELAQIGILKGLSEPTFQYSTHVETADFLTCCRPEVYGIAGLQKRRNYVNEKRKPFKIVGSGQLGVGSR